MLRHLRVFARFAADRSGDPAGPFGLADLRPELLDAFEADLVARYGSGGTRAHAFMGTVVRLLRHAGAADPAALTGPVQARLSYATSLPHRPGRPLDAYPIPVLEAIQRAALADVRAIRDRIDAGRRRAAAGADPAGAGWSRPNALWHAAAHGPLTAAQFRGMRAVRSAPGGIGGINAELFLTPADLVPLLVALICLTGLEPECAKALRADCLSSPSAGFLTLSYRKNRAHTRTAKTMRVRDGSIATAGGLIKLAVRPDRAGPGASRRRRLVGRAGDDGLRAFFDRDYELTSQLRSWAARQSARRAHRPRWRAGAARPAPAAQIGQVQGIPALGRGARRVRGRAYQAGRRRPLRRHRRAPGTARAGRRGGAAPGAAAGAARARGRHPRRRGAARTRRDDGTADAGPGARGNRGQPRRVPRLLHRLPRLPVCPQPGEARARPRSGDACNARTRCSPNGTCPASSASRRSSRPSGRNCPRPTGRPAMASRTPASPPGSSPRFPPRRSRMPAWPPGPVTPGPCCRPGLLEVLR